MRHAILRALALVVSLAIVGLASAGADDDSTSAKNTSWMPSFFQKPAPAKSAAKKDKAPAPKVPPSTVKVDAQATLLRRQDVILRLREIAAQEGDDELNRQADVLEERSWSAFVQASKNGGTGVGEQTIESSQSTKATSTETISGKSKIQAANRGK